MRSSQRNAKTMLGLGIVDLQFEHNRGTTSVYLLTLLGGENLRVEVPVLGSTDTTVLRKAAELLKDRPVRYESLTRPPVVVRDRTAEEMRRHM